MLLFMVLDFSEGFTFCVQRYFKMPFSIVPLLSLKTGTLLQFQHAPPVVKLVCLLI